MTEKDKLLHLIDGNLPPSEARELERRLKETPELGEEFGFLHRIRNSLSRRPPESSPGLWEAIEARLDAEGFENPLWGHLVWAGKRLFPFMAAAALVLMAVSNRTRPPTLDDFFTTQTELVLSAVDSDAVHFLSGIPQP